jgi:nicotinamidase-related amidase
MEVIMHKRHPRVLEESEASLLVVDVQERFSSVIDNFEQMAGTCVKLVRTFRALDRPITLTEQYPKGLGKTVSQIAELLGDTPAVEKTCFSSCEADGVAGRLEQIGGRHVVVCGIEAHVCVSQSVHDLLQLGRLPHVVVDAVSSRRPLDRELAFRKMESSGAVLTTAEAAAFELMRNAHHSKFKEIQSFFK